MRRIFICISLLIMLAACGKPDAPPRPDLNISSAVDISYKQMKITADTENDENGTLKFIIRSPDNLEGVSVICDESGITAVCGEVEIKREEGYYPFVYLYDALKKAKSTKPVSIEKIGDGVKYVYDGFTIIADEQTNKIRHIETEYCDYEVT